MFLALLRAISDTKLMYNKFDEILDGFEHIIPEFNPDIIDQLELLIKDFNISIRLVENKFHRDHFPYRFDHLEYDFQDKYFGLI